MRLTAKQDDNLFVVCYSTVVMWMWILFHIWLEIFIELCNFLIVGFYHPISPLLSSFTADQLPSWMSPEGLYRRGNLCFLRRFTSKASKKSQLTLGCLSVCQVDGAFGVQFLRLVVDVITEFQNELPKGTQQCFPIHNTH